MKNKSILSDGNISLCSNERKLIRNHYGKIFLSEFNLVLNQIKDELAFLKNAPDNQADAYCIGILEIENFDLFDCTDTPHYSNIFQDKLLKKLADAFLNSAVVRRTGDKRIVIAGIDFNEKQNLKNRVSQFLNRSVRIVEGVSILPIYRMGIAKYTDDTDITDTYREAAIALDYAAFNDSNHFMEYIPEFCLLKQHIVYISTNIENAIKKKELHVLFHPQIDSADSVIGFEALIRWESSRLGIISPEYFIPILEKTGQISTITDFVLEECCSFIHRCQYSLGKTCHISINISPFEIIKSDFIHNLQEKIQKNRIKPEQLILELTENGLLDFSEIICTRITELAETGFLVVIDDFGKGISSLSEIKDFCIHGIKIDKSFLSSVPGDQKSSDLLKALLRFLETMSLNSVIEGVENQEQLSFLRRCGCEAFQGYYFSKPLNSTAALALLGR